MAGGTNLSTTPNAEIQSDHSIQIPPPPQRPDTNFPSLFFISYEEREKYLHICLPMYEAALKGDWQAAKGLIVKCPKVKNASITKNYDTALHIASSTKHIRFVEELVKLMEPEDLELKNLNGNTALCLAAVAGTVKIAEIMLKKNKGLLRIRAKRGVPPLVMAAMFGHKDMVSYLYSKTNNLTDDDWNDNDRIALLNCCVDAKLYDVALKILERHKKVAALKTNALCVLARKPLEFDGARQPVIWTVIKRILPGLRIGPVEKKCQALQIVKIILGEVVKLKDNDIRDIIGGPLFIAAELGNAKFLIELIRSCPELIWMTDDHKRITIFQIAILNRQESIYNLLYEIGPIKDIVTICRDTDDNSMLHLAAMKPDQNRLDIVSGVALQMQRELLWFKEVETMVHPFLREEKNKKGKTPKALFTEEHTKLMEKGETWMKETSSQCMVVATLIATIMFAAAFTLPGGNNNDNGNPIFLNKSAFIMFVITDAISLFTSSASILMFLAILTARYAENDFLVSLPTKLMIGLLSLFISITTMMVAFSASFFLTYTDGMKWVPILITVLAGVPVLLFASLQYRLLFDMIRTTFGSRVLFKPKKHMLY